MDAVQPEGNQLSGRRFVLEPLIPQYHRSLYNLTISDEHNHRWRFRGVIPTYEMFERSLYGGPLGTLCQFVILPKTDKSQLAGLVMAYGATLQDGYCYLGVMIDSKFQGGALEGVALFIRYLFDHWPFRKIYLETVEYDLQQFQSAVSSGLFREEGRLRAHQYFRDQYWDVHLLAAYREDLHKFTQQFSTIFLPEAISTDKSSSHDNR